MSQPTCVRSSPPAIATSQNTFVSSAPRLSHTPPTHEFSRHSEMRDILPPPMQTQAHPYFPPQFNPTVHYPQNQPRFDFQQPLEPYQQQQQFGQPAGYHPTSQGLPAVSHTPAGIHNQPRHSLGLRPRPEDLDPLQSVPINHFHPAIEHGTSRDDPYSVRSRHDLFGQIRRDVTAGGLQFPNETQVKRNIFF